MSDESIEKLSFWEGPVTLVPLEGGITNRNYIVEDERRRFVARACADLWHLGIDRRNEIECQAFAATLGVAPAVAYHEEGVIVSEFVTGKTLGAEDVQDETMLSRVARTLRTLHDSTNRLEGAMLYFFPFQVVRTYTATARRLGATLPPEVDDLLQDARGLEAQVSPFRPTLCHNDLLPANLIDAGDKLWLVDWEYAGVGNPLFDLAGVSANCALDDEQERALIEAYYERPPEQYRRELKILKTISLLREALWAVIQTVASDLEFDYGKYRDDNLEAYRTARRALN